MIKINEINSNIENLKKSLPILEIDSVFLEQGGKIEKLFYKDESLHELRSCAKLLVAMAIGIAIDKEMITLDTPIYPSIKNIVNEKDIITNIEVKNATKNTKSLNLLVSEDIPVLANNSDDLTAIQPEISLNDNIEAPIEEGQAIGKVSYTVNGITYTTNLIAANNVEKFKLFTYILYGFGFLILILIIYRFFKNSKKTIRRR